MRRAVTKLMGVLIALVLMIGLLGSLVVTKENEYKLIREFGRVSHIIDTADVNMKIPFIQSTSALPKEILLYDLAASDVITMDRKTVLTGSYMLQRITDPLKFAQVLNSSIPNAERGIDTVVYSSIKDVISSMSQNDVISGHDGELSEAVMKNINDDMDQYGIQLLSVQAKRLGPPTDNKAAVHGRMISGRDRIAVTYMVEGQSEAKVVQNTTDREIAISVSDVQARAARTTAAGEAEYVRILTKAYSTSERTKFYKFIRALDATGASLIDSDNTLILLTDSPITGIFMRR